MHNSTRIRLIEPSDAAPIAAHRVRDFEAFRRPFPSCTTS